MVLVLVVAVAVVVVVVKVASFPHRARRPTGRKERVDHCLGSLSVRCWFFFAMSKITINSDCARVCFPFVNFRDASKQRAGVRHAFALPVSAEEVEALSRVSQRWKRKEREEAQASKRKAGTPATAAATERPGCGRIKALEKATKQANHNRVVARDGGAALVGVSRAAQRATQSRGRWCFFDGSRRLFSLSPRSVDVIYRGRRHVCRTHRGFVVANKHGIKTWCLQNNLLRLELTLHCAHRYSAPRLGT